VQRNLDNSGTAPRTFVVHATPASVLANLDRVNTEGKISDPKVYAGLRDKLVTALKKHQGASTRSRRTRSSRSSTSSWRSAGRGINAAMSNLMIGSARDIIATGK
jgi:hypothetical protein